MKKWYEFWKNEKSENIETLNLVEQVDLNKNIVVDLLKEAKAFDINPYDLSNSDLLSAVDQKSLYFIDADEDGRISTVALKRLSEHPIISSIIQTRVNQCAEFAKYSDTDELGFKIVLRDKNKEITEDDKNQIAYLTQFIENCGNEVIDFELTFEQFIRSIVRDSLIYDQCNFEIVRNRKGDITGFIPVDASTIRRSKVTKAEKEKGQRDNEGIAYVQVLNNKIVAQYGQKELCFGVRRPRTEMSSKGYGYPELQELVVAMNNLHSAEVFNASNFNNGISANGIIAVKSKMDPKLFRAFRREFYQMLTGVNNAKRTPLIQLDPEAGEEISSINLSTSNKEMEYNAWVSYLIKIVCAVFQVDPAEIGFVFGNEGSGNSVFSADPTSRIVMGKEKGLRPLVRSIESWLNKYIIWQIDPRFKLEFTGLDSVTPEIKMGLENHRMKYMTLNEIRTLHDLPEVENGDVIAAYYGSLKIAQIQNGVLTTAEESPEIDDGLSEPIDSDQAYVKKKVDFDNDGQSHPKQYFTGLDEKTKRKREKEIEQKQKEDISDDELYEDLPGDEDAKTKPSKYTNHPKAEEIREEMKSNDKDEFIRAASKVSGVDKDIIEEVYDKGLKAHATSGHRPGATAQQWAIARVYAFLFFPDSGARKADAHLWDIHLDKDEELEKAETYVIAPKEVAEVAQRALDAKEKHGDKVKGGLAIGWKRARQLANQERISETTVRRMFNFFNRHSGNQEVSEENKDFPWADNGYTSWQIWGGDEGRKWATKLVQEWKKERQEKLKEEQE